MIIMYGKEIESVFNCKSLEKQISANIVVLHTNTMNNTI